MTAPRRRKNNLPNAVWYGLTVLVTTWIGYLAGSHRTLSSPPSAAVPAQPFRFLSEQAGEESPTNEDKDDSVLDPLNFLTIICIVLVLIALTLGFEFLKEHLEHSVEEECEIILEKFFGELTVLGFLAMVTFIFSQTGIADMLSERIFGEKKELLEYFEYVYWQHAANSPCRTPHKSRHRWQQIGSLCSIFHHGLLYFSGIDHDPCCRKTAA